MTSPAVENPEVFVVLFVLVVAAIVTFVVVRARRREGPPVDSATWHRDDQGPGPEGPEP